MHADAILHWYRVLTMEKDPKLPWSSTFCRIRSLRAGPPERENAASDFGGSCGLLRAVRASLVPFGGLLQAKVWQRKSAS